jgi:lysozyme family protein
MGLKTAGKILQKAINILNREEYNFKNLIIDGIVGKQTIRVLLEEIVNEKKYLIKLIVLLKAKHYLDIIEADETQEVFIRGWINRINL